MLRGETFLDTFGDLSSTEKIKLLETMVLSRVTEEKIEQLNNEKALHGTNHLCIGQEASHTGLCAALDKNDWITATHRGHGFFLAKGGSLSSFWAEMFGLSNGCCKGLGGSMHLADIDNKYMCSSGVVAAGVPISAGIALSLKYKHKSNIAVSVFGDGASNQGMTFETMNLAVVLQLPILFYCENNGYAVSSRSSEFVGAESITSRANAFGINSTSVNGNDIAQVYDAVKTAANYIRTNTKPFFIEVKTYRIAGHSRSDNKSYRTHDEENLHAQNCPIKAYAATLIKEGLLEQTDFSEMISAAKARTNAEADKCLNLAKNQANITSLEEALQCVAPSFGGVQ